MEVGFSLLTQHPSPGEERHSESLCGCCSANSALKREGPFATVSCQLFGSQKEKKAFRKLCSLGKKKGNVNEEAQRAAKDPSSLSSVSLY